MANDSRVDIETLGSRDGYIPSGSSKTVYTMTGNKITLYPTPLSTETSRALRVRYYRKPSELVEPGEGAIIANIDTGTGVVSVQSLPTGWSTSTVLDFTQGIPPFELLAESITPSDVTGVDITVDLATAALLSVGDTIAETGYSIVPQIAMPEAHRLLEEACVINILEGIDDSDGLMRAEKRYDKYLTNLRAMLTPRDDAGMKKMAARNDVYTYGGSGRYW